MQPREYCVESQFHADYVFWLNCFIEQLNVHEIYWFGLRSPCVIKCFFDFFSVQRNTTNACFKFSRHYQRSRTGQLENTYRAKGEYRLFCIIGTPPSGLQDFMTSHSRVNLGCVTSQGNSVTYIVRSYHLLKSTFSWKAVLSLDLFHRTISVFAPFLGRLFRVAYLFFYH